MPISPDNSVNSSKQQEASGEIGGEKKAQKGAEARRDPAEVRKEIADLQQTAKSSTDMYREYFKKSIGKEEAVKKEMEMLMGMKERGSLNLSEKDLQDMEQDGRAEAATLKRIAEKYRGDAVEADRAVTKLEAELSKLESNQDQLN
jgi:hypothetical protein